MQRAYGDCCMPISRRTGSVFINDRVSAIIEISAACFSRIAPLAQLDRASGYEPEGREFESLRAHHLSITYEPAGVDSTEPSPPLSPKVPCAASRPRSPGPSSRTPACVGALCANRSLRTGECNRHPRLPRLEKRSPFPHASDPCEESEVRQIGRKMLDNISDFRLREKSLLFIPFLWQSTDRGAGSPAISYLHRARKADISLAIRTGHIMC